MLRPLLRTAIDRGGLVGVLVFALYLWVAPQHVVDGDNAEFATLSVLGGAAHPSGYPLYILWLRAWSWLPAASPAHAAALATALLGVLEVVTLQAAARAWGVRPRSANLAALLFATAPVVLTIHTEAEVFALNGLGVSLVLWLAAAGGPLHGRARCIALALVAGLAMSNHLTCTLVAPVGLVGFARGLREAPARRALTVTLAIAALAAGLTPYLYLLGAPEHQGTWGSSRTLGEVLDRFLRQDYGGPGAFAPHGGEAFGGANLVALLHMLARSFLWVPAVAGLAMLNYELLPRRAERAEPRASWIALAASFLLAGPLLVLRFNIVPQGVGLYAVERFHLLPATLLVIPVARAFDVAGAWLARTPATARLGRVADAFAVAVFIVATALSLPHVQRAHVPAVEYGVRNTLRSLPPDAVVIGAADDLLNGTNYLQLARGERPDVVYVQWALVGLEWYRERIAARVTPVPPGLVDVSHVLFARDVLATGRPLFVDSTERLIIANFPTYPHGPLFRVLAPGQAIPPVLETFALNQRLFAAFEIPYATPGADDAWPSEIHRKYAIPWRMLARQLTRANRPAEAAWALEAAQTLAPHDP